MPDLSWSLPRRRDEYREPGKLVPDSRIAYVYCFRVLLAGYAEVLRGVDVVLWTEYGPKVAVALM